MVAKITQAKAVGGMLQYNNKKLEKGEASILGYNKIITGGKDIEKLGITQTQKSFDSFGNLNKELKRKYIHVSLNPHPDEKLSDEKLTDIAKDYMKQLGYASQPYIIYKHTDIERTHLHIVSCNVKANGKTITDSNLFRRSNEIRKGIEKKYDLKEGAAKKNPIDYANTKKVDYKKGDNNAQIKTKALTILSLVKFSSFDSYKRHMANYNIAVDIRKEANHPDGKILGSTYQVTNDKGVGEGLAIKASHIDRGGNLDLKKLEKSLIIIKRINKSEKIFLKKICNLS
ncbi:MAG: relaxase/mobilization nuclease domain-containing protein [Chitinophagaceae bacterium]|nr:relaxase/mobilization nuclease domain-containing protein [Chitinophagaceae bacterium]